MNIILPTGSPDLITQITAALLAMPAEIGRGRGDGYWTKEIKRKLGAIGDANGWCVCSGGMPDDYEPEWLYDLDLYKWTDDSHDLQSVGLVLESEWSQYWDAIRCDFQKLLLAKCDVKVMIFQDGIHDLEELFGLMQQSVARFSKSSEGETYLLAGYRNKDATFVIKTLQSGVLTDALVTINPR